MNMTKLEPRCIDTIYYDDYYPNKDLLKSVGITLKNYIHYYTTGSTRVPRQFLSDDLWEAISWIQLKFYELTINVVGDRYKKKDFDTVIVTYHNGASAHIRTYGYEVLDYPPDEAFDLVEGFIFINKYREIPESIKRMMDKEEAEMILRG